MEGSPLLSRVLAWAEAEPNVLAVIMTGSRARAGAVIDRFSDHDVEIIASDPAALVDDAGWSEALGELWVYLPLDEDQPYPTRLCVYAEGKVDFTLAGRARVTDMVAHGLDALYERGYRVLLDKDGLTAALPDAGGVPPRRVLPTEREYRAAVAVFWFEAAHLPAYLAREELWVVKFRDWTLKERLLEMLEWHALATGGAATDVWHIGTGMQRWTQPETWRELQEVFGRFDAADSRRALDATVALYRRLSREVAEALSFAYPEAMDRNVSAHLASFSGDA